MRHAERFMFFFQEVVSNSSSRYSVYMEELRYFEEKIFSDERGYFFESYRADWDLPPFVQDNQSFSKKGVVRGMHIQKGQAKLVRCAYGEIYDVAVDCRKESPTYGKWKGFYLSEAAQLYIPDGFAHGFLALTDAVVCYKVSSFYDPSLETGFRYDDHHIAIEWPSTPTIVSPRDAEAGAFGELCFT